MGKFSWNYLMIFLHLYFGEKKVWSYSLINCTIVHFIIRSSLYWWDVPNYYYAYTTFILHPNWQTENNNVVLKRTVYLTWLSQSTLNYCYLVWHFKVSLLLLLSTPAWMSPVFKLWYYKSYIGCLFGQESAIIMHIHWHVSYMHIAQMYTHGVYMHMHTYTHHVHNTYTYTHIHAYTDSMFTHTYTCTCSIHTYNLDTVLAVYWCLPLTQIFASHKH